MRLSPRSLTGQLALLILVAFLVAQFISLWLFTGERGTALQASLRVETAERAAAVIIALEEAAPDNRPGILAAARSHHAQFDVGESAISSKEIGLSAVRSRVTDVLGSPREIRAEEVGISPRDGRPMTPPAALAWLRDRLVATIARVPPAPRLLASIVSGTLVDPFEAAGLRECRWPAEVS